MPRRIPISHKKRKAQLVRKRAVKRGDIDPPLPSEAVKHRKHLKAPSQPLPSVARNIQSTRRLESSFVKLPPAFLEKTKALAFMLPLARPIPPELAIVPDVDKQPSGADAAQAGQLTCPRRPKWRYDMSKKEIEANEHALFEKWLQQTDAAVNAWCSPNDVQPTSSEPVQAHPVELPKAEPMPHAPTSFERNIEVWRQLWRVTEISQILLILLDSRCPTLHFPPALSAYLSSVSNASRLRIILVLTKVDISGPERAAAWTQYLNTLYPDTRIVQVESYSERHPHLEGSSSKRILEPHLPSAFRRTLVDALRFTHAELLQPPSAPANWKPRIKSEVDWDAVLKAHGGKVGTAVGGAAAPNPSKSAPDEHTAEEHTDSDNDSEPEFLTIGVIGQPNVGKSSLLNALFGTQKVRTSRTPGKTKHFQTLFWTSEVRLVDCPGLVFPNYVPMEAQVLSGILPISRVSAIPLCVYHAARLLPLEKVLGLEHPSVPSPPVADKRTWREGMRPSDVVGSSQQQTPPVWTAMDVLIAYANKKGWVTAQAGRPDVHRAGNAILRAVAEGRIHWAFWPPGTDSGPITRAAQQGGGEAHEGAGIWIAHGHDGQGDVDAESEGEQDEPETHHHREHESGSDEDEAQAFEGVLSDEEDNSEAEEDDEEGDEVEDEDADADELKHRSTGTRFGGGSKPVIDGTVGRFGALILDEDEDENDD